MNYKLRGNLNRGQHTSRARSVRFYTLYSPFIRAGRLKVSVRARWLLRWTCRKRSAKLRQIESFLKGAEPQVEQAIIKFQELNAKLPPESREAFWAKNGLDEKLFEKSRSWLAENGQLRLSKVDSSLVTQIGAHKLLAFVPVKTGKEEEAILPSPEKEPVAAGKKPPAFPSLSDLRPVPLPGSELDGTLAVSEKPVVSILKQADLEKKLQPGFTTAPPDQLQQPPASALSPAQALDNARASGLQRLDELQTQVDKSKRLTVEQKTSLGKELETSRASIQKAESIDAVSNEVRLSETIVESFQVPSLRPEMEFRRRTPTL